MSRSRSSPHALDDLEGDRGLYVPIHVDGASGGFVAPFIQPELEWDFRIPRVQSINASGHKYGLVYPGVGWAVWRDKKALPKDLVFNVNYLGGNMPTFALNFSRPGSEVIAQYYMFSALGHEGYKEAMQRAQGLAMYISSGIADIGPYRLISDGSELPVFAFTLNDDVANYSVYDVSDRLRQRGWLVPAYTFPENRQDLSVLRIVIRAGMSREMADLLLQDLREETEFLESPQRTYAPRGHGEAPGVRTLIFSSSAELATAQRGLSQLGQPVPGRLELGRRASLEYELQVEDPHIEAVELAPADHRVAWHAGLPAAGGDLGDELADQALLVDLALAGDHGPGLAHPHIEVERVEEEARSGHQLGPEGAPTARRPGPPPLRSSAPRAGRARAWPASELRRLLSAAHIAGVGPLLRSEYPCGVLERSADVAQHDHLR